MTGTAGRIFSMKTVKRIVMIVLLLTIILAISYALFTCRELQNNNV